MTRPVPSRQDLARPIAKPPCAELRRHGLALVIAANGIGIALAAGLAALLRV